MRRQPPYFEAAWDVAGRRHCHVPWSAIPGVEADLPNDARLPLKQVSVAIREIAEALGRLPMTCWIWHAHTLVGMDVQGLIFTEHVTQLDKWTGALSAEERATLATEHELLDAVATKFNVIKQTDTRAEAAARAVWKDLLAVVRGLHPDADDAYVVDFAASLITERGLRTNCAEHRAWSAKWRRRTG